MPLDVPYSSDGVELTLGMKVLRINTQDAGKTWFVTEHRINGIFRNGDNIGCSIVPDDWKYGGGWYSTGGHNRFFVDKAEADKEIARLMAKKTRY